jgi:hypothetical protein
MANIGMLEKLHVPAVSLFSNQIPLQFEVQRRERGGADLDDVLVHLILHSLQSLTNQNVKKISIFSSAPPVADADDH